VANRTNAGCVGISVARVKQRLRLYTVQGKVIRIRVSKHSYNMQGGQLCLNWDGGETEFIDSSKIIAVKRGWFRA